MGLAGLAGLSGLLGVVGDNGAGWSFTSGLLGEGSRAVGDRARLAWREKADFLKPGHYNLFSTMCLNKTLFNHSSSKRNILQTNNKSKT